MAKRGGGGWLISHIEKRRAASALSHAAARTCMTLLASASVMRNFGIVQWLAVSEGTILANEQQVDARDDLAYSPPFYPTPWMNPQASGWSDAYTKAKAFVSQLTLLEKVNITTGVG